VPFQSRIATSNEERQHRMLSEAHGKQDGRRGDFAKARATKKAESTSVIRAARVSRNLPGKAGKWLTSRVLTLTTSRCSPHRRYGCKAEPPQCGPPGIPRGSTSSAQMCRAAQEASRAPVNLSAFSVSPALWSRGHPCRLTSSAGALTALKAQVGRRSHRQLLPKFSPVDLQ